MNINDFTVKTPKFFIPLIVFSFLFTIGIILFLLVDNPLLPALEEPHRTMLIFFLPLYILTFIPAYIYFTGRRLDVKDGKFYNVSGFGPAKIFTLDDIKRIKYENDVRYGGESITLYSSDQPLAFASVKQPGYPLLLELLLKEGVMDNVKGLSSEIIDVN